MSSKPFDVFLSYNSTDGEMAASLADRLQERGLKVWFDRGESRPGAPWLSEIETAIGQSRSVTVLIGSSGVGPWQEAEVEEALKKFAKEGHPVIPVILPGVEEPKLPPFLWRHTWVDCRTQIAEASIDSIAWGITGRKARTSDSQFGDEFLMTVARKVGTKSIRVRTLPNRDSDRLLDLTWETFGQGLDFLVMQIRNQGFRPATDACFGINDAGLVMATFINSCVFERKPLGHLRYQEGRPRKLSKDSVFPELGPNPTLVLFDFEVKTGSSLRRVLNDLRGQYQEPRCSLAVFGAMTESGDLQASNTDGLIAAPRLEELGLQDLFIACTMGAPGVEPPLELR